MPGKWGSNAHDQTGGADVRFTCPTPSPPDLFALRWPTPLPPDLFTLRFDPTCPGRMSAVLCYDHARSAVSSNGRTLDSESSSWGSNPCTAATPLLLRTAWLRFTFASA